MPPPAVLFPRLQAVYDFFKELHDPMHQRPFFNSNHAHRFRVEMAYVLKGYLSDPLGVPLYIPLRTLKTGLVIFRCVRTTSALEGYHCHLRQVLIRLLVVLREVLQVAATTVAVVTVATGC
jgi:hypothetical protein